MKKVLLLPGWMTSIKLYKQYTDLYICLGKLGKESLSAQYVIGVSLGALVVLRDIKNIKGKVILINPPVPKRSFVAWFSRWLKYMRAEGLFFERQSFTVNPIKFVLELANCIKLLNIDFSSTLDNVPKDKITVIRGKDDVFFCDSEAVNFLHSKNIHVMEFEGGHNLCKEMEETMNNLIV